jgi:uncharacterized protein YjbJ (UPF0337 family)
MGDAMREGGHGFWEDVKGRVKSAIGALTGRRDLDREGQAQQDKAGAERDAARREAEAARARAQAEVHEARQRGAQRDQ